MITSCRNHWDYILNTEALIADFYDHSVGSRVPTLSVPVKRLLSRVTVLSSEHILMVLDKSPFWWVYCLMSIHTLFSASVQYTFPPM